VDFRLTEEQEATRKEMFDVCQELNKKRPRGFAGLNFAYDTGEGWKFHRYCAEEFVKRGWLALNWPEEYGGKGTMMDRVFFAEARGYYDIPGVDGFGVGMLAPTLIAAASEEIKRQFLPPIAAAEVTWCELWSEPNAGSDLAAVGTTAIKKGDKYIINGQKIWTSGAHNADWGFGLFKTDPQGAKRHNLSFLLLDMKTPGITLNPILYMTGEHTYNEIFFDDVHVPARQIVGAENEGWKVTQLLASFERSNINNIMTLQSQLKELVQYCNETEVGGELLAKNPAIRDKLAEIACELEADRVLAYRIADLQNRNQMTGFNAAMVKVLTGELTERLALLGTEILGPFGQVKFSNWAPQEGVWPSEYQHCFTESISMGTDEIQKNIMAWYGLGLPKSY